MRKGVFIVIHDKLGKETLNTSVDAGEISIPVLIPRDRIEKEESFRGLGPFFNYPFNQHGPY